MLVKKVNPEWFPSENRFLQVGETIEMTDPRSLILDGKVKAVGEFGEEISAFELYGEVIKNEMDDYKAFMETKKQEAIATALSQQKADLEAKLAEATPEVVAPVKETKPAMTAEEIARAEKVKKELSK